MLSTLLSTIELQRAPGEKVSDPPLWMPSWKLVMSSRV